MRADQSVLPPLVIVLPLMAGCVFLAAGRRLPRRASDTLSIAVTVGMCVVCALLVAATANGRAVSWSGGWQPVNGFSVGVVLEADRLGAGLALLAAVLTASALVYSWRYFDTVEAHFHVLMQLFLAGMAGFAVSGDLFDMFVFFELMGAAAYALTAFKVEDPSALQGGFNFAVVNSLGAYLTLMGIGILYARTGQLGLPQLSQALAGHRLDALVAVSFVVVLTGFLVKAALVPFHFWLDDAHAVAPTPVSLLLSGVMVELGLYGIVRIRTVVFGAALPPEDIRRALLTLGVVTAVVGAGMCYAQRHLKRLLAYSTIAHVGLFLTALAVANVPATAGAALYVAAHAGAKGALFLLAGILLNRYGSVDEITLYGRGRGDRLVPALFLLAAAALAGLPPFGTGLGKAVSEEALGAAGYAFAPALFVAVSAVTAGAVLRAVARIFFGLGPPPPRTASSLQTSGNEEETETQELVRVPPTMLAPVAVLLATSLALGVGVIAGWFGPAAEQFLDRAGYVAQAMQAMATPPHTAGHVGWTSTGILLGLLSTLLAVGVAGLALQTRQLPAPVRAVIRLITPLSQRVRAAHSGHVGDYVAWLLAGIVALTAAVGLPQA